MAHWLERIENADIPTCRVNGLREVFSLEQVRATGQIGQPEAEDEHKWSYRSVAPMFDDSDEEDDEDDGGGGGGTTDMQEVSEPAC